jgi:dTDP-4-dehydrorhamnose reductase
MSIKVWVVGHNGLLGSQMCEVLESNDIEYVGTGSEFNTMDLGVVVEYATENKVTHIINCAAYTDVVGAEIDSISASMLNTVLPMKLAQASAHLGLKLIHFSTDYVFNGNNTTPYTEDDVAQPLNVYASTKNVADKYIETNMDKYFIFRIAGLYGKHGNNFVHAIIAMANTDSSTLNIVSDNAMSPTNAENLCNNIITKVIAIDSDKYGMYNYTDVGGISWFDFATVIANQASSVGLCKQVKVMPIPTQNFGANVTRPLYSVLDTTKVSDTLGFSLVNWHNAVCKYIDSIK